ncbi:MAG: radical SAM protein [Woeseia sp.]|nr:radical SAM protein [Woeseia sp.]
MKILAVNPALRLGSETKYLPTGLAYILTYIEAGGYEFDLLDIDINDYDDQFIEEYLQEHRYDIVLIGSIVTHYAWVKWFVNNVKNKNPKTKIIVGNSVGGSIPETFLHKTSADVVVIGEGEVTCLEVLDAYQQGTSLNNVDGIAYVEDGSVVQTDRRKGLKKIDEFPIINWDIFDVERYFSKSYAGAEGLVLSDGNTHPRVMPVVSARGCVFKCTFCHYVYWNDPYRYRTPENILIEIKRNIERYGANYINFWDDLSFGSLKQVERLADAIIDSGLKFNWNAAVRVDLFGNPKYPLAERKIVAKKVRESGCLALGFSLESGDPGILDMMEKKIEPQYFLDQVDILREAGISSSTSVVFGYPLETKETIKSTFDMCFQARVYPSIGFLLPLPSTKMYQWAWDNGYITDEDKYLESITERQDICLNMTDLPDAEVMGLISEGAEQLNRKLELGLEDGSLIRTGGYRKHTKSTADDPKPLLDPEKIERHENDISFNYSQALFEQKLGDQVAQESEEVL